MDGELIEALSEPTLLVRSGLVVMSNAPARAVLGDWIDGRDIRLAIRHPRAVERLLDFSARGSEELELARIGEAERRWLMTISVLSDGSKLVRLLDRSEAFAAEKMRVDFVANASHELRTPLATLIGFTETLLDRDEAIDAETRRKFLGIIHDEARRMQRLIDDLISLSRIEGERFRAPRETIALDLVVREAKQNWSHTANEASSTILLEIEPDLPPIPGDRAQLIQLVDNLLSNAIRYGRENGHIRIALARDGNKVRLAVADDGEGIPSEHLPRLTERFYRVNASRSRAKGGTGLGLSIVKHIVERHNGRLQIQSQVGKGTTVTVLLPIPNGVAGADASIERSGDGTAKAYRQSRRA